MDLINKSDKIFVAGSSGMVGSAILRELKEQGYENIFNLDLDNDGQIGGATIGY